MMGTKLIKLAIFLSYFVGALVVENNGDMLNGFKNLFDGWFGNYKNTKNPEEIVDKLMFDSEKNYDKIHLPHSAFGIRWGDTFYNDQWPGLLCGLCIAFIIYFIVSSRNTNGWCRDIVKISFCCFLVSIPWEWFRMYKSALSKKVAASIKEIPPECFPNNMPALNRIMLWLKDQFSTGPDQCALYHEAILVDPLWEVSPLMATSACLSRLLVEPLKQLAATSGECFKLFFREIPVQWQPLVFIVVLLLVIVLIFCFSGFEISTPLLRIGSKNTDASKITTYEGKIYSLGATNESLKEKTKTYKKKIKSLAAANKSLKLKTKTYKKKI